MLAVYASSQSTTDPLSGLVVGDVPAPEDQPGWVRVHVKAAALNHHDLWSLKGVGLREDQLPMILGCDAAGVLDDGTEVIVHAVVASEGWQGDETLDPKRSLFSEHHPGTLAEQVLVPARNWVRKPADMPWETAACLSTAWLTAYRMLFTNSGVQPGGTILVQGAGGGVATALIQLGAAAGFRVFATSRDAEKREKALALGAEAVFESGARLPEKMDAVMETVGAATWSHSVKSLKPGGTIVISGATSGDNPDRTELTHVFFKQLRVVGSTMGNRDELERLVNLVHSLGITPAIDSVLPMERAAEGFAKIADGSAFGKIVLTTPGN